MTCEFLGLVVNRFVADEKYPVLNRDNLTIPIQIELSQGTKNFSEFFSSVFKSSLNFELLEEKDDPHSFCIFEVTDPENVVR